ALFVLFAPSRFSELRAACLSASAGFAFLRVFALPRARCSLRRGGDLLSPAPESRVRAAVTPKTFALFVLFAPSRFSELRAACLSTSARFAFLRVFALPRARCSLRRGGDLLSPAPESRVPAPVTLTTFALFVLFAPSRFSEL